MMEGIDVRNFRNIYNLSLEEMSILLSISKSQFSMFENGKRNLSFNNYQKVIGFIKNKMDNPNNLLELKSVRNMLKRLSPKKRKEIYDNTLLIYECFCISENKRANLEIYLSQLRKILQNDLLKIKQELLEFKTIMEIIKRINNRPLEHHLDFYTKNFDSLEEDVVPIGNQLFNLRKHLSLTQQKFSEILSISKSHLSRIETNQKRPSIGIIKKINNIYSAELKLLGLSLSDLKLINTYEDKEIAAFMNIVEQLPHQSLAIIVTNTITISMLELKAGDIFVDKKFRKIDKRFTVMKKKLYRS